MSFTPTTLNYPQLANTAIRRYKANHAPNTTKNFILGDEWLNLAAAIAGEWWKLSNLATGGLVWVRIGGGVGQIEELQGDTGGPVGPNGSSIIFTLGTANQITVTGTPGTNTLTWSLTNGVAASSFGVDAHTAPGTSPVVPTSAGLVTITGGQVAAGTTTNVIRTDSLAANTYTVEVQRSQAVASSTVGDNGVCHFDSSLFTVDANGFVSMTGGANYISLSPYIVGTDVHSGYSTIAAAITAAIAAGVPANIYIKPKVDGTTYTENLTLSPSINLISFDSSVSITGTLTFSSAGSVDLRGLNLTTNSAFALVNSGSAASLISMKNCSIGCTNNTGISFTNSNASSLVYLENCIIDLQTTGIAYFADSSAGLLQILKSQLTNTGASTTASTISAGSLIIQKSGIAAPITVSGTGSITSSYNGYTTATQNVTTLNIQSNVASSCNFDSVSSGTAQAITVTVGNQLTIRNCDILSTNAVQVGGAGTIVLDRASLGTSTSLIAPTTLSPAYVQYGINRSTNQPSFLVQLNSDITNVSGDGTDYSVLYDTLIFDQNSNVTLNSAGVTIFTAPVTGKYQFNMTGNLSNLSAGVTTVLGYISVNGVHYRTFEVPPDTTNHTGGASGSIIIPMTATQTANVIISAKGGTKTATARGLVGGFVINFFSGFLVC